MAQIDWIYVVALTTSCSPSSTSCRCWITSRAYRVPTCPPWSEYHCLLRIAISKLRLTANNVRTELVAVATVAKLAATPSKRRPKTIHIAAALAIRAASLAGGKSKRRLGRRGSAGGRALCRRCCRARAGRWQRGGGRTGCAGGTSCAGTAAAGGAGGSWPACGGGIVATRLARNTRHAEASTKIASATGAAKFNRRATPVELGAAGAKVRVTYAHGVVTAHATGGNLE